MARTGILLLLLILTAGCSRDNAFRHFQKLDSDKERAVLNMRRVILKENNQTVSLFISVYLNAVYPELYHDQNSFLVSFYDKQARPLEAFSITLNGQAPLAAVLLEQNCTLRRLMPLDNPWSRTYQMLFPPLQDQNLTLRFESDPSLTGQATFRIDR